jgi:hypothetical protein
LFDEDKQIIDKMVEERKLGFRIILDWDSFMKRNLKQAQLVAKKEIGKDGNDFWIGTRFIFLYTNL